jgi:oxygen-independent coproporphyrinogen-3 oxidase
MGDAMFLGLRLVQGVNVLEYKARFGVEPRRAYGAQIKRLVALGLLEEDGEYLRLSARGRLLANQVFAEFVGPPAAEPA